MVRIARTAIAACLLTLATAAPTRAQESPSRPDEKRKAGSFLVAVPQGVDLRAARSIPGYEVRPLFGRSAKDTGRERSVDWIVLVPTSGEAAPATWAQAHEVAQVLAKRAGYPVYVEPNVRHEPVVDMSAPAGPDTSWPTLTDPAWHLGDKHSQLRSARASFGAGGPCKPRIVILDTGIYRSHATRPRDIADEKNFVEPGKPADDPYKGGGLNSPGHGTATIAVLAGARVKIAPSFDEELGGAPKATIVPVRIADSVVHFYTDEMAQGIDYAYELAMRGRGQYCDVVSISMGGVASRAWAEAVNRAYDAGVTIVAAAGNNYGDLPTRYTVYPSRFARIVTVAGAVGDHTPFRHKSGKVMQGNYGPPGVMRKAIAAYTANVTRARWGTLDAVDLNGSGTSYATPQVAAAAALWLARNGAAVSADWKRVEAVRLALFETAEKRLPSAAIAEEFFGNGILRAAQALGHFPKGELRKQARAEVSFPFLRVFLGLEEGDAEGKMHEVEANNLALMEPDWAALVGSPPPDDAIQRRVAACMARDARASSSLRRRLERKLATLPPTPCVKAQALPEGGGPISPVK